MAGRRKAARAAGDPVILAGCLLAALLAWRHEALWTFADGLLPRLSAAGEAMRRLPAAVAATFLTPDALGPFASPTVRLALVLAPAMLWASWRLFRRMEQSIAAPFAFAVRAR